MEICGTDLSVSHKRVEGIIESFELAFRMQAETPELIDLSGESKETQDLYGIGGGPSDVNGRACLMARRMSEAGVRFVQVTIGGWDHHGDIRNALPGSCAGADQPLGDHPADAPAAAGDHCDLAVDGEQRGDVHAHTVGASDSWRCRPNRSERWLRSRASRPGGGGSALQVWTF